MKLYTVAGTSILDGKKTYRFANSMSRVNVLTRCGHQEVQLQVLPQAMTKEAAVAYLKSGNYVEFTKTAAIESVKIAKVKTNKSKETVLWKSMSSKMRAIPGMSALQFAV